MKRMMRARVAMDTHGWVYTGIKPANVLYIENDVVVDDTGRVRSEYIFRLAEFRLAQYTGRTGVVTSRGSTLQY